jgi:hypothetical protein
VTSPRSSTYYFFLCLCPLARSDTQSMGVEYWFCSVLSGCLVLVRMFHFGLALEYTACCMLFLAPNSGYCNTCDSLWILEFCLPFSFMLH